jgi:hypothetical protein
MTIYAIFFLCWETYGLVEYDDPIYRFLFKTSNLTFIYVYKFIFNYEKSKASSYKVYNVCNSYFTNYKLGSNLFTSPFHVHVLIFILFLNFLILNVIN